VTSLPDRAGVLALTPTAAVAVDVVVWTVLGVAVGYGAHRLSSTWLARDRGPTRLLRMEAGGRVYERVLRIQRWKRYLPDAGPVFSGGRAKRSLVTRAGGDLERFAVETRRAELTHWVLLAAGPFFLLWNPWSLALVMVAYAVVANVPCLLVQRYNRARIERLLDRRSRRPHQR
jgi:glycosyl-4,4'-diaponeurosporenoate acyltransferase